MTDSCGSVLGNARASKKYETGKSRALFPQYVAFQLSQRFEKAPSLLSKVGCPTRNWLFKWSWAQRSVVNIVKLRLTVLNLAQLTIFTHFLSFPSLNWQTQAWCPQTNWIYTFRLKTCNWKERIFVSKIEWPSKIYLSCLNRKIFPS